ncbi:MAG TPA: ferritin-like domain-containing protein [Methylomirabilota bacterium]|nr:ferritin-like domain-containing protein [Methylomirabilota bacterium]
MATFDLDAWVSRSGALDLDAIPWEDVAKYPVPPEAVRTLTYMQDIESHTIIYLRSLLQTRAVDDSEVSTFLACWLHEETFHGIALARFLERAGYPVPPRAQPRGKERVAKRLESWATSVVSKAWPDFCAVHMTWGAINELTTLTGYLRLKTVACHPVLEELLETIMRDESRHFFFYYRQAEIRLQRPGAARVARMLVDRFWAPVGSGVGSDEDLKFMARYLFAGPEGRAQARKVDDTLRKLPGFDDVQLLEAWIDRHVDRPGLNGGVHGHRFN